MHPLLLLLLLSSLSLPPPPNLLLSLLSLQVEATKFTEVGYHGRDVDQIIRDLVETSMGLVKSRCKKAAAKMVRGMGPAAATCAGTAAAAAAAGGSNGSSGLVVWRVEGEAAADVVGGPVREQWCQPGKVVADLLLCV
jgi:hypothetical protein